MINNLSLIFSLVMVAFVVVRAAMLDKTLPWFKAPPKTEPKTAYGRQVRR